jgi:D-alanyl-lipoteichoic acid acyltransferase DltB (MBOAT superfamily)
MAVFNGMKDSPLFFPVVLAIYILTSRLAMRCLSGMAREVVMALLNLAGSYLLFLNIPHHNMSGSVCSLLFMGYVGIVVFQYLVLLIFSTSKNSWLIWLAFFCPIAFLISDRYTPSAVLATFTKLVHLHSTHFSSIPHLIGISYLTFRCSRLVLEVRNGSVKMPGPFEYLCFAFFLPTMSVGPINTYANHRRGFETLPWEVPLGRAALRILVGLVKYQFLGAIFNQLTYSDFLLNGHPHHWIELPVAMIFYYLYLYCNFSGFCDMAIGAAAIIGIPVQENFDNPFAARNMREFWNRWHITLSQWMRDIVFAPLSKCLVRAMGPANVNHAVAIAIFVVFLLIGIWHGVGWNYAIFGLFQALGVVATHYYSIGLKKWLGRDGFKEYNENRWIHALAVTTTFCYYAGTLFFFANTLPEIREIFSILR